MSEKNKQEIKQTSEIEKPKDFWSQEEVGYGRKFGKSWGFPVFAGEWPKTEQNYTRKFASADNYGQSKAIIIEGGKTTIAIPHFENEPGTNRKEKVINGSVHNQTLDEAHLGSLAQFVNTHDNPTEVVEKAKVQHEKRKMGSLDQLQTAFDPEKTSDGVKHFRQRFWRALDQLNNGLSNRLEVGVNSASDASVLNIIEMVQDANNTVLIIPDQQGVANVKPPSEQADLLIVAKTDSKEVLPDEPQSALGKWFKKTLEQPDGLVRLKTRLQEIPNRRAPLLERLSEAYPDDAELQPLREKFNAKESQKKSQAEMVEKRHKLSAYIKEYEELAGQFEKNKGVFSALFSGTTRETNKRVKEFVLPDVTTLKNAKEVDVAQHLIREMIDLLKHGK